jgi:4'-phosphopantetheinyl transferase
MPDSPPIPPLDAVADAFPGPGEVLLLWLPAAPGDLRDPDSASRERLLRQVLAPLLGRAPEMLRFEREARGRPFLRDAPPGFDFNFSGTRGGSVLALSRRLRVGVDLERSDRRPPALRLARRYFDPVEAEAIAALPEDQQAPAFVHAWTAKEAACKATGSGLRERIARWRFEIDAAGTQPRLLAAPDEDGPIDRWDFRRLRPAPGFTAVVAAAGRIESLRQHTFTLPQSAG